MRLHIRFARFLVLILKLTRKTATYNRQRFRTEILAKLEEFKKSQTVTLVIVRIKSEIKSVMPTVFVEFAVFYRTDGIFPLITAFQIRAFNNTPARKTENTGFHIEKCLSQIFSHTVFPAFPSICRKERYVFEVCGNNGLFVKAAKKNPH